MNKETISEIRNELHEKYTKEKTDYFKEFIVPLSFAEMERETFQIFDLLKKIGIEINELDETDDLGKTMLCLPVLSKGESPQLFWIEEKNDNFDDQKILGYISYKISENEKLRKFRIRIALKIMVFQRISNDKIQILLGGKKNYT